MTIKNDIFLKNLGMVVKRVTFIGRITKEFYILKNHIDI